jgi:hypothetical protein
MNPGNRAQTIDPRWIGLCRVGGVAALVAALIFRRNLAAEYLLLRGTGIITSGPTALPTSVPDWFSVLHDNRLVGLTLLNLFDVVNYALVGLILLGLYAALRQTRASSATLALIIGIVGVAVYLACNQAFALAALSDQYAAATTDADRSMFLAAGQALLAVQSSGAAYGNGFFASFFCVELAGLIMAVIMLHSRLFGRIAAYFGILANAFGLAYYVFQNTVPALTAISLSLSAVCLLIWYIVIGVKLLRLQSNGQIGMLS